MSSPVGHPRHWWILAVIIVATLVVFMVPRTGIRRSADIPG